MYAMQTGSKEAAPAFPLEHTLLLNTTSQLIGKLADLTAEGASESDTTRAETIARQIWQLSVLSQRRLTADELRDFLSGSYALLSRL